MIHKEQAVDALIDLDKGIAELFRRYQNNSSSGEISIAELCENKDLDPDFFVELLNMFQDSSYVPEDKLKSYPVSIIIDYLLETHRYYQKTKLPEIELSITNLQKINHDTIYDYLNFFIKRIQKQLEGHFLLEECHLFPYIANLRKALLIHAKELEYEPLELTFSVEKFENMHNDKVESYIEEVIIFLEHYRSKLEHHTLFEVLIKQLSDFNRDLRIHALIEDRVLIPLGYQLEKECQSI